MTDIRRDLKQETEDFVKRLSQGFGQTPTTHRVQNVLGGHSRKRTTEVARHEARLVDKVAKAKVRRR